MIEHAKIAPPHAPVPLNAINLKVMAIMPILADFGRDASWGPKKVKSQNGHLKLKFLKTDDMASKA